MEGANFAPNEPILFHLSSEYGEPGLFVMERQEMRTTRPSWGNEKASRPCSLLAEEEASTGFEPVMRVLQTLALPLGHDAGPGKIRAGDGIRTHDLLLGKETFYH